MPIRVGLLVLFTAFVAVIAMCPTTARADEPNLELEWSASQSDPTHAVAWGDYDGDGDLDLAVGNDGQPIRVYPNSAGQISTTPTWSSASSHAVRSLAWGDYDGNGNLDLAAGSLSQPTVLYASSGGTLSATPVWSSTVTEPTRSIAWADVDGDGDLDLALGNDNRANQVYYNNGTTLTTPAVWSSAESDSTYSVAWGDYDGDGDLDLAVGNNGQPNRLYRNNGGALTFGAVWSSALSDTTRSLAWGDYDGDGDLDLAAGNYNRPVRVYRNTGSALPTNPTWSAPITETTVSVAWGDYDGDGDLDLVVGNESQPTRIYRNDGGTLTNSGAWVSPDSEATTSVAWGDYDADGDLDLAVGNRNQPSRTYRTNATLMRASAVWSSSLSSPATRAVAWGDADRDGDLDLATAGDSQPTRLYVNSGTGLATSPGWWSAESNQTTSLAWGDVDGDGDLDLAIGNMNAVNRIYLNVNGTLSTTGGWLSAETDPTTSVAWGDYDGDGNLDLAVGNDGAPIRLYRNTGTGLQNTAAWSSHESDSIYGLAWGDVDGDGDLDLAAGNRQGANRLYRNDGGLLSSSAAWSSSEADTTYGVAWGDYDADGDLDLAVANSGQPNRLYRNDNGMLTSASVWSSYESDASTSVAWGDYDGDGDLDLAVGNGDNQPIRLYRNDRGSLTSQAAWSSAESGTSWSVAWGDLDGDGDLDLATGNTSQPNRVYLSLRAHHGGPAPTDDPPHASIGRPLNLPNAGFHSSPTIIQPASLPVAFTYRLYDTEGHPVRFVRAFYSLDGGGQWQPATLTGDTDTTDLATAPWPTGVLHTLRWDAFADGLFGRQDNVAFRVAAYPAIGPQAASTAGPYVWGATSGSSFPFRVQGTQVRVLSGTTPISNAMVYRLPAGQSTGGTLLADGAGEPRHTDTNGYLPGSSDLHPGDRLLALAPVDWSETLTWAEGLSGTLRLYYSNGVPTENGLDAFPVTQPGVQTVVVAPDHPLLLLDLIVSLDWTAQADTLYLDQLRYDLKRASQFLYDFANGQLALGRVSVFQNADVWDTAHVLVKTSNHLRPFAVQGGLVVTSTIDPQHGDIVYNVGQVRMGATWNRYGNPGQNLGVDWPLALAHELSHFALFLDDTYLGLNDADLLIPVDTCTGSAMGDMYDPSGLNTEFLDAGSWLAPPPRCAFTLANRTLQRSEWETIRLWYPMLHALDNPGPAGMPFDFTTVHVAEPLTPTATLADPTFYLDYDGGAVSSSDAGAYLIQADSRVRDLGAPVSGQNRVLARGARPGDRLCVFDLARRQHGCEVVETGDERLDMESNPTWTPLVQVTPVTSTTLELTVAGLPAGLPLRARLYPEYGIPTAEVHLVDNAGLYQATLNLAEPALVGYMAVWVDESATESDPRRETIVAYAVGGNPGNWPASRGNGPASRGNGPASRGNGPASRGNGAPVVSPDGQMIFFSPNPALFADGELYAVQRMAGLPPLPFGKTAVGGAYRLIASPGVTHSITGSISFQYLGIDALVEGVDEAQMVVHFWNGNRWRALETVRSPYYNLASASSQGAGVYALLSGLTVPRISSVVPSAGTNDVTHTLTIRGNDFLEPVEVRLSSYDANFALPVTAVSPVSITAVVTMGLSPAEYRVQVVNLGQTDGPQVSPDEMVFALFDPLQACFYDFFESGVGQWQRGGEWDIVLLSDGQHGMTDSPAGPYLNANNGVTRTTAVTTTDFSLQVCNHPRLSFRHDYSLVELGNSVDIARVEISADGGQSWAELASYRGGVDLAGYSTASDEWNTPDWQYAGIGLGQYTGTVQLRFSVTVDRALSDKGWLIDDVVVAAGRQSHLYLPTVMRQ